MRTVFSRQKLFCTFLLLTIWTAVIAGSFAWNNLGQTILPETAGTFSAEPKSSAPWTLALSHLMLWVVGSLGIVFGVCELKHRTSLIMQTETCLKNSECRHRLLFDDARQGIGYFDLEGNVIELNTEAAAMLGGIPDDFQGKSVNALFGEEIGNKHRQWIDIASKHSEGHMYEQRFELPTGKKWLLLTFTRIQSEDGQLVGVLAISVDVTERKKAELALKESEERFRALVTEAPVALFLVRKDRFVYVNSASLDLFGLKSATEIEQCPVPKRFEKALQDLFEKSRRYDGDKQKEAPTEIQFVRDDGKTLWLNVSCVLVRMVGEEMGIVVAQDITGRKIADEEIKKFRTISDSALHGNVITDFEGNIQYANDCFARIFGYEVSDILHSHISMLCDSEQLRIYRNSQNKVIANGGIEKPVEVRGIHRDGTEIPLLLSGVVLQNDHQGKLYIACALIDLTEQKRLEKQLRQAQKMETIGNFVGGLAHDFNNLLFPIVGMAEMLVDSSSPGSLERENAREILNAGMRGSALVKQILAFSRQSERRLLPVRVQNVIEEVIRLSRRVIPANIEIDREIQKNCGFVMADAVQIHQVAMNVINNAFHAVEDHGGSITVRLREIAVVQSKPADLEIAPGKYVELSVVDTGCGIAPSVKERMFDPYYTTKPQGKGTGLGLAVVYGIVKEHGGEIKVESEVGEGSAFHIYLPTMSAYTEESCSNKTEAYYSGDLRILFVDDEAPNVQLVKQMLEKLGYQVTTRTSSVEALTLFRGKPDNFDLVITDMSMPNMTGEKLAEEITALRPDIPIIICTGFSERMSRKKAAERGIKGFLLKPIVLNDMANMIRTVMFEKGPT